MSLLIQQYPITPCPKPRMTQRDHWQKRPAVMRYRAFCDECRLRGVALPEQGAGVTFILPMPKSWSEKKKRMMNGVAHKQKPDITNLLKALEDALYGDDSAIWHYEGLCKRWGREGRIIIETTGGNDK